MLRSRSEVNRSTQQGAPMGAVSRLVTVGSSMSWARLGVAGSDRPTDRNSSVGPEKFHSTDAGGRDQLGVQLVHPERFPVTGEPTPDVAEVAIEVVERVRIDRHVDGLREID